MIQNQFFWLLLSFILTVMIFSYIFGDNPLFRIAAYLFVGVSSAYVLVLIFYQILIPKLIMPLFSGDPNQRIIQLVPILLSVLLLFKLSKKASQVGDFSLAFLVGSGAAIILTSAFTGTLLPMIDMITEPFSIDTISFQNFFGGVFIIIGTVSSLLYFQFSKRTSKKDISGFSKILHYVSQIGIVFIGITLGSVFAGVIISSVIALIERLNFIITFIYNFFIG
ncbi:MAG: hypothetical protein Q7U53_05320 [Anaerolineaceae bacterium]|nr:hypothetical protein [Anaerolineaceae bacterium]